MNITTKHRAVRWLAPVAVVAVVAGAAVIGHAVTTAAGAASLPEITAAQLIADIEHADPSGVSGTVVESADLGLPDLSGLTGGGSSDAGLLGLITGTHTLRVWYGGPTTQRVALLGSLGESDIIRNGQDLWTWDSSDNSATHRTLPAGAKGGLTGGSPESTMPIDPQQAAQTALGLIGASTTVTVDNSVVVAGRAAYELVLSPKSTGSLISAVRIAVDGTTFVPLRVQIDSVTTKTTAFSVGFTSVDFGKPDAAEFSFTPPPGATVNAPNSAASGVLSGLPHLSAPGVVGSGWTTVLIADSQSTTSTGTGPASDCPVATATPAPPAKPGPPARPSAPAKPGPAVTAPSVPTTSAGGPSEPGQTCAAPGRSGPAGGALGELGRIQQLLPQASGRWGSGRVLAGTLFTVVITDDHRIAVGPVTPAVVYAALGGS